MRGIEFCKLCAVHNEPDPAESGCKLASSDDDDDDDDEEDDDDGAVAVVVVVVDVDEDVVVLLKARGEEGEEEVDWGWDCWRRSLMTLSFCWAEKGCCCCCAFDLDLSGFFEATPKGFLNCTVSVIVFLEDILVSCA